MPLSLNEIQTKLSDRNLREVARRTEVPYDVIYRLSRGKTTRPTFDHVAVLIKYFEENC